ncbi:MAG: glycoside hydrolase family 57 protein [Chloroflexia bacterium]
MTKGYLTFVLHSHMPYVRQAGRWPFGEEMLHEAMAETYLPLLNALHDLRADGVPYRLTVGITPILAEQLADPEVLDHFEAFLLEEVERAHGDVERFQKAQSSSPDAAHLLYLARFYEERYRSLLGTFRERFHRDLVGAFHLLQDEGYIEILTSAATHAYLPLMERDSTIYGQLRIGVTTYLRHFGRLPRGIWLPECGYRPAFLKAEGGQEVQKPGLEEFLAELNLRYTFVETHAIERGRLSGKAAGDVVGPYGGPPKRKLVVPLEEGRETTERTTFRPYYIQNSTVAVFGRDARTGKQVWSASEGYPGDFVYREFHRKDDVSGLQYWRVTGDRVDLGAKELYDPYLAFHRAQEHAAHFAEVVREHLLGYWTRSGRPGIVVAAYDTELFGHWWFEGISWLKEVLLRLSRDDQVELMTAGEYLEQFPPEEAIVLPEGSWGKGGDHSTWMNPATEWMWPLIHEAEQRMEYLVGRFPDSDGERLEVLKQAARELLLLESSDWPFLIDTGQAVAYATDRFQGHLARFNRLCVLAEKPSLDDADRAYLQECQRLDNPFFNLDYRVFAAREGLAG